MTELKKDILRQPDELIKLIGRIYGEDRNSYAKAAALIRQAGHLYLTGIGASWHAGMAIQSLLDAGGWQVSLLDASELLHCSRLRPNSVILMLSRSGKSIEIVRLLAKATEAGAKIIGITNAPQSPLAQNAEAAIHLGVPFDHSVSILTYSAVALAGGILAVQTMSGHDESLGKSLAKSLQAAQEEIGLWEQQTYKSDWFDPHAATYFLARGTSLASCHEARLLWEEAAKAPATALSSGGFRHGPQEILDQGIHVGMWIDRDRMRREDLAVAADIRGLGGRVMLVGQNLSPSDGDLVFEVPQILPEWQFLLDILPAQLAAERLSHLRKVDCDSLRICSYVVESEYGIIGDD
jgi:glucosamine--fructose-6-phosphate aminotransferase (isomerizing)